MDSTSVCNLCTTAFNPFGCLRWEGCALRREAPPEREENVSESCDEFGADLWDDFPEEEYDDTDFDD